MSWINLFLENKSHENPRACVCTCSRPAYAGFMHAYAYMGICTYARVSESMKGKFSTLNLRENLKFTRNSESKRGLGLNKFP